MKIYTTTGDAGTTSLAGGARVPKYHPRVEAYGAVDELCSHVGLLRAQVAAPALRSRLLDVQQLLMKCGGILSNSGNSPYRVTDEDILRIENQIDAMQAQLADLKGFILPGGSVAAAQSHVARCVCRRAERAAVLLASEQAVPGNVLRYLNRLSDYLFVLARTLCREQNIPDEIWVS